MKLYKFRESDGVYNGEVEVPDAPTIPKWHTLQPPPIQDGYYAVMRGGWKLVAGEIPPEPEPYFPPPVGKSVISKLEFLERFTQEEQVYLYTTPEYVPFVLRVLAATEIDLQDETSQSAQIALSLAMDGEERIFSDERISNIFSVS
jgi:hypothetical protein